LKIPGLARTFEPLARQARDEPWPHEDYLNEVLAAERALRHDSVIRQRLRDARFPEFQVDEESVLAGACDGRAPATGRTRRDESQEDRSAEMASFDGAFLPRRLLVGTFLRIGFDKPVGHRRTTPEASLLAVGDLPRAERQGEWR
jgi:hypothetical protein